MTRRVGSAATVTTPFATASSARGHPELLRREAREDASPLGRRGAQRRAEHAGGERAESPHVPRAAVGVAHHHVDRRERHAELVGRHLGLRSHDALAHLDLAGEDGDAPVGADQQIGVQIFGIDLSPLRKELFGTESDEDRDAAADQAEERPPVDPAIDPAWDPA